MKNLRIFTAAVLTGIIGLAVIIFFLPVPGYVQDPITFRLQLVIVSSFSLNYFGAALLFLYGMRDFKPEMRKSYYITTVSMEFFGLANMQYPLLIYAGLIPGPWLTHGGSLAIVIPGVLLHYLGARSFAKALGTSTRFDSISLMFAIIVIISSLTVLIPHKVEMSEFWYAVHQISTVINMIFNFFTAAVFIKIMKVIGHIYLPALRWITASVILSSLGFLHVLVAAFFGQNNPYTELGATAVPFILVAISYVIAGYYFCKIRFYALVIQEKQQNGLAMLDAVTMLADLVSQPKAIDKLLDDVRIISSKHTLNQGISKTDRDTLVRIYLKLEDYLLTREKLRSFTRDGLRARLNQEALELIESK